MSFLLAIDMGLEDDPFLLEQKALCAGAFAVSFREGNWFG